MCILLSRQDKHSSVPGTKADLFDRLNVISEVSEFDGFALSSSNRDSIDAQLILAWPVRYERPLSVSAETRIH